METIMARAATRIGRGATRKIREVGLPRIDTTDTIDTRRARLFDQAVAEGLIGGANDARISGRVPGRLIEAAKKRAQISSDTELIEYALMTVALEDDFGMRLVRRKGSVPKDMDLEH
jgi:hypothetical protein